jgi:hypothetical protein
VLHHKVGGALMIEIGFEVEREAGGMVPHSAASFACLWGVNF